MVFLFPPKSEIDCDPGSRWQQRATRSPGPYRVVGTCSHGCQGDRPLGSRSSAVNFKVPSSCRYVRPNRVCARVCLHLYMYAYISLSLSLSLARSLAVTLPSLATICGYIGCHEKEKVQERIPSFPISNTASSFFL